MGVAEEVGKVATTAVTSLGGSPALLAMIVLNLIMIFGVGFVAKSQVEERRSIATEQEAILHRLIDMCGKPQPGSWLLTYPPSFTDVEVKP